MRLLRARLVALGGLTLPRKAAGPRGAQLVSRVLERAASYVADFAGFESPGSTVFRTAKYTSHEVTIDDEQLKWFEDIVQSHPSADGWKIFVFTHAPPIGSGLRVLQARHNPVLCHLHHLLLRLLLLLLSPFLLLHLLPPLRLLHLLL